jgi:hypothetical protein
MHPVFDRPVEADAYQDTHTKWRGALFRGGGGAMGKLSLLGGQSGFSELLARGIISGGDEGGGIFRDEFYGIMVMLRLDGAVVICGLDKRRARSGRCPVYG